METLTCKKCGADKPVGSFVSGRSAWCKDCRNEYQRSYRARNPQKMREYRKRYYEKYADECREKWRAKAAEFRRKYPEKARRAVRESTRKWRETHREEARRRCRLVNLRDKYGLTLEEYDRMVADQNGRCAICGEVPPRAGVYGQLNVDHDHSTGRVRALLCTPCNLTLGKMRERPDLLRAAAGYLEKYRG